MVDTGFAITADATSRGDCARGCCDRIGSGSDGASGAAAGESSCEGAETLGADPGFGVRGLADVRRTGGVPVDGTGAATAVFAAVFSSVAFVVLGLRGDFGFAGCAAGFGGAGRSPGDSPVVVGLRLAIDAA